MKKYTSLSLLLLLSYPARIYADSVIPTNIIPNPLGDSTTFSDVLSKAIDWLITISAPILVIVVLYGAFLMLTDVGNEKRFETGKKTILYAAIGFFVILVSKGMILIIKEFLGVSS